MTRPVVLHTIDRLREDYVGCYGYDRPTTPNIGRIFDRSDVWRGNDFVHVKHTADTSLCISSSAETTSSSSSSAVANAVPPFLLSGSPT